MHFELESINTKTKNDNFMQKLRSTLRSRKFELNRNPSNAAFKHTHTQKTERYRYTLTQLLIENPSSNKQIHSDGQSQCQ